MSALGIGDWELTGHSPQTSPSNPKYPDLHRQFVLAVLAAPDTAFAGHASQGTNPTVILNVFAGHARQSQPFSAVYPALHPHTDAPGWLCELT